MAKIWAQFSSHLKSSDPSMAMEMHNWTVMFALKCKDRDSFIAFYSMTNKPLHKLTAENSIAATDNIFLKAFMAKVPITSILLIRQLIAVKDKYTPSLVAATEV